MTGRSITCILLLSLTVLGCLAIAFGSPVEALRSPPAEYMKVGNYWEYAYEYDSYSGAHYEGNITMELTREEQRVVSGEMADVFMIDLLGTGAISGEAYGNPVSGTLDIYGVVLRLRSNFSLISEHVQERESQMYLSETWNVSTGVDITYNPSRDDVIGDTELTIGSNFTSRSEMRIDQWIDDSTSNETQIAQNWTTLTFALLSRNQPVVTPAGSYLCDKYAVELATEENEFHAYWYYSDAVGNYVKSEGFSWFSAIMPIGDLELRSYSYSTDNVPPVADAGSDRTVRVGDVVTLDGSASSDDVGIVSYNWTFTDAIVVDLSGEVAYHTFATEGVHVVNLTVLDEAGNSDWDTIVVTVEKKDSLLSGPYFIPIVGIAAAVVVVILAILFLRKRKGKTSPEMPESFIFTVPPK